MADWHELREKQRQELSGHNDPALCKYINEVASKKPTKDQTVNLLLYLLLRHIAKKHQEGVRDETAENALKEIMQNEHMKSIPIERLENVTLEKQILWQLAGINADGDDEVSDYFKKNGIDYLSPEPASHETLEETSKKFSQRPLLKPPSPRDLP